MRKLLLKLILLLSIVTPVTPAVSQTITPPNFKVAFIGDQSISQRARDVLQLIKAEGADMVLHQGDLAYSSDINGWDQMISEELGVNFPYFASVGNHDQGDWSDFQQVLNARLSRVSGASCSGAPADLGIQSSCTYEGLFFILSGAGTLGGSHADFIRDELEQDNSVWSICSWHKNQREMQIGGKGSETGWQVYEECRIGGAIIATGHEHSYSRTKTLTSMQSRIVDPEWPLVDEVRAAEGATFAIVSGIAGISIRDQERCFPSSPPYGCNGEWASIYSSTQGATYGALFCSFNVDGNPNKAHCYFKDIFGAVPDQFNVTSFLGVDPGSPPVAIDDNVTTGEDMAVDIDVMVNDSDADGDTLLLVGFDSMSANGGTVTRLQGPTPSDDELRYDPAPDFNGLDSYDYEISDGFSTATATVRVTVVPVDDPPVAINDTDSTAINTPVTTDVLANDSDADGDTVVIDSFGPPNSGTVLLSGGGLRYTPNQDFLGIDSYLYTVTDNKGGFDTARVTVTVADNEPPIPNPAAFASAPSAISDFAISMMATTGSDPSGPVQYLFTETSGNPGGTDSGWQTSAFYTDNGLFAGTQYTYTVQMRDSVPNVGSASTPASAMTTGVASQVSVSNDNGGDKAEAKDGKGTSQSFRLDDNFIVTKVVLFFSLKSEEIPGSVTFNIGTSVNADAISGTSVNIDTDVISNFSEGSSFEAYEIFLPSPVALEADTTYYLNLENSTGNPLFIEMDPDASYSNGQYFLDGDSTGKDLKFEVWGTLGEVGPDITPPSPDPATFASAPAAISDSAINMTATTGVDASGPVQYLFTEISGNDGGKDSGWQLSTSYTDDGLTVDTQYIYTVQMRDALLNTGTASDAASATPTTGGSVQVLESNASGGDKAEEKDGKGTAQSFSHDSNFSVTKVVLYLSLKSGEVPSGVTFNIGTGINSNPIAGSSANIDTGTITNFSEGSDFNAYEIVFAGPVVLDGGTTYYLNIENDESNSLFIEMDSDDNYGDGEYFFQGDSTDKDLKFEVWGR